MKHFYLKSLFLGMLSFICITASAYDCKVNGIYYYLDRTENTARVTYKHRSYGSASSGGYSYTSDYEGEIIIPPSFIFEDITYIVTKIDDYAFISCYNLTSVTIPNNVVSIGEQAFYGCNGLTSIDIPNSVTTIGRYAFKFCNGLSSVTLGNSVTSLGSGAFEGCSDLTSVNIPSGVTSIRDAVFKDCSSLTSVSIPNSVTSIGVGAFYRCEDLTSITIPNSVTDIDAEAFSGCSSLTSVSIPNSVINIGNCAFYNCSCLTSITIEDGTETLFFDYYYANNTYNSYFFTGSPIETLYIGRNINYVTYTGLKPPFAGISSLKSVSIGNSVTSLDKYAFSGCNGLTSVIIPPSVTSIGNEAFADCYNLEKVIAKDIAAWCKIAFANSSSNPLCYAHHLYSDENVEITELTIPNSVTSIGCYAFYNCTGLSSVTIPSSVTTIGDYAFNSCSRLTSINIPSGITSIEKDVFKGCSSLTSVIFEDGTETLYFSSNNNTSNFADCPIESIYLGRNINFSDSPFAGKSSLSSVTIGKNVTRIEDNAFQGCIGITAIELPNRMNSIGNNAFQGCIGITAIDLPNRINSIGQNAFQGCSSLTTLSFPISMTSIGDYAFYGCTNLESVYSEITDVFSINAFEEGCDAVLYVPYGTKLKYIQTSGWNVFNDIIEMDPAIMNTSLLLSCNSKGSITINGTTVFTNKIGSVDILEDAENTIVFTPKANCKLEQVCFNGFDITTSVENNTLKAVIPAKSQMVVMFSKQGDLNNDGNIDISDVVSLVNMILGQ